MPQENYCQGQGWLVGSRGSIPSDPLDFGWKKRAPTIGCNNLRCSQCGCEVRNQAGFFPKRDGIDEMLWNAADWSVFPDDVWVKGFEGHRLYVCKCQHYATNARYALDDDPRHNVRSPWSCAGHAIQAEPYEYDGHLLTESLDYAGLIAKSFTEERAQGGAVGWARDLHGRFAQTPVADWTSRAVASLLDHDDVEVRLTAVAFFHGMGPIVGFERLIATAEGDRNGFRDVADPYPTPGGPDLEGRLMLALMFLLQHEFDQRPRVLALLKKQVQEPGRAGDLVRLLMAHEYAWVKRNAPSILRANPESTASIIGTAQRSKGFVEWAIDLGLQPGVDTPGFRRGLEKVASPRREQVLDALPGSTPS